MPFVVSWGDRLRPSKSSHIAYFADLMPTFADLAGATAPENDGISFAPILRGKVSKQVEHDYLYWEFPGSNGWVAVRMGEWKGVLMKANQGNNQMELYNIEKDPRESANLAKEHPEIVTKMWEIVRDSHEEPVLDIPKFKLNLNYPSEN